jgi:hypothetical protein
VGVLDAFLSTWSNARSTFGEGTPQTGPQFDNSVSLRHMQATVQSAAPGSNWTGGAANAYGAANAAHAEVFGKIADLDQRLSAKVDQSAQVVGTGRRNLDTVRQWVLDAAAAVPPGKNREQMLMPIVQRASVSSPRSSPSPTETSTRSAAKSSASVLNTTRSAIRGSLFKTASQEPEISGNP